jgi:hypothetical protein
MTEPKDPQLNQLNRAVVQLYRQRRFEEALPLAIRARDLCLQYRWSAWVSEASKVSRRSWT